MKTGFALLFLVASSALTFVKAGDGGCGMGAGTALAICLGIGNDCSKLKNNCEHIHSTKSRAECYCKVYSKAANCWKQGICCTEFPAHARGAELVCSIAKQKHPKASTLAKYQKMAQGVVDQTCHNNCGYDIPCLDGEPKPYQAHGNCQTQSYFANGKCTGRHKCNMRKMMLRRDVELDGVSWE